MADYLDVSKNAVSAESRAETNKTEPSMLEPMRTALTQDELYEEAARIYGAPLERL